jgi:hypothetical protein
MRIDIARQAFIRLRDMQWTDLLAVTEAKQSQLKHDSKAKALMEQEAVSG